MNQEGLARWIKSLLITLLVFSFVSLYIYARRGIYNEGILNKIFGSTSVIVAGFTLLIGPLAYKYRSFARLMSLRRELGLLAFAYGLIHVYYSVIVLSERFTLAWYIQQVIPITFGGLAIGVWVYVASISTNKSIKALGSDAWRWRQRIGGHIAFALILLHVIFLKYSSWVEWIEGKAQKSTFLAHPQYPPENILIFLIVVSIILYRLILVFRHPKK